MNKISSVFIIVFYCLIFISSCDKNEKGVIVSLENEEFVFPFNYTIEKQKSSERIWEEVQLQELFYISGIEDSSRFQPLRIRVKHNSLYVLDVTNGYIKEFDFLGNFQKNIGNGFGEGPGEFTEPFDFSIDSFDNLYIVDIDSRSIISLNKEGQFRWEKQFVHNTPGQVVASDSIVIASVTGMGIDHIFESFDINGEADRIYNNIVIQKPDENFDKNIKVFGMPVVGNYEMYGDQMIFIPRFIPQIIYYDKNGVVKKAINTMDEVPNPIMKFGRDERRGVSAILPIDFEGVVTNLDFSIINNEIIVWSQTGNEKHGFHVFDIYELETGEYRYSYKLDLGQISGLEISSNNIFTYNSSSTDVKGYSLKKLD